MAAEIEGSFYINGVKALEVEKVGGAHADFVRVRVRGDDGKVALSLALWGPYAEDFSGPPQPEVIILEKDERKADAGAPTE